MVMLGIGKTCQILSKNMKKKTKRTMQTLNNTNKQDTREGFFRIKKVI